MSARDGTVRREPALLVLADGAVFEGEAIGGRRPPDGVATGEAVFNTVLSGYQEVITDPSYAGQVIAFTYPHIGNYGVNPTDDEAARPHCRGVIVRDLADAPVATGARPGSLEAFLVRHGVPGHHRHRHPAADPPPPRPRVDALRLRHRPPRPTCWRRPAAAAPTDGRDLVVDGRPRRPRSPGGRPLPGGGLRLRHQGGHAAPARRPGHGDRGAGLHHRPTRCWPSSPTASSSPTAPATPPPCRRSSPSSAAWSTTGTVPVFGICLGHQLLATALGATTYKLPFGHHGGNHPVRRLATGRVEITSPEPQLRGGRRLARSRRGDPRQPQRRGHRRPAQHATPRPSASSTTPRPAPAPTTPATCSRSSGC